MDSIRFLSRTVAFAALGLISVAVSMGGCAAYQYQIAQPMELAGPIDSDGRAFSIEPLEYRVAENQGRLALRVYNPTDDGIILIGERSSIVDPRGEARALRGGVIPPGSRITMILPPQPARVYGARPSIGVGVGVGRGFTGGTGYYSSRWDGWHYPRHLYMREGEAYWQWETGRVFLQLTYEYEQSSDRFEHQLVFNRVRIR